MSKRLANTWTKTTEEAFGKSGTKGRIGEVFVIDTYTNDGYTVVDHENSRSHQLKGIDISFRKTEEEEFVTADVKHNINNWNTFYVECANTGWLFKTKADQIIHCNVDKRMLASYNVKEMQQYVSAKPSKKPLLAIEHIGSPSFVNWRFNV